MMRSDDYLSARRSSSLLMPVIVLALYCSLTILLIEPAEANQQEQRAPDGEEQKNSPGLIVGGFKLSKLFDFSEYKRIYGKKYTDAVQELARMKLYLGGVLRVIIAAIKHRFLGKRYYLAVNRMTDWTDDEWHKVSMSPSVIKGQAESGIAADRKSEDLAEKHFEAADLSDIDTKLPEIFKGRETVFQEFIDEMGQQPRGDDNANGDDKKLSADKLFRSPKGRSSLATTHPLPKSNNPNYELVQVMSQTDSSEPTEKPLDKKDAEDILQTHSLLDNILDGIAILFNAAEQVTDQEDKKIEIFSEGPDEIFVDHRDSGCLGEPRHQLECGSCYAFASMALYEYLYCMQQSQSGQSRSPVQFSIQYLVDCGPSRDEYLKGCSGGNPIKVAEYVNKYGLELEANYPYAGEPQVCPYEDGEDPASMGYIRVDEPGLEQLKPVDFDDMLKKQPVLINLYPNSELKAYGGGIYDNYVCEYKYAHAMLLVGHGRKDQQEYWIIRNSLGSEWGEGGYLYMNKGAALNCLVDDGTISRAKFLPEATNPKYSRKDMARALPKVIRD